MANDLQAQLSTQLGNTLSQLSSVRSEMKQLNAAIGEVNNAANHFQNSLGRAYKHSHEEGSDLADQVKEGAHAFHLMGGITGEVAEKIGHVSRLASAGGMAFGFLAAGAVIAGTAFELYSHAVEISTEKTEAAIQAEKEHRQAMIEAAKEAEKTAGAGGSRADSINKLDAASGGTGNARAQDIATGNHFDIDDVRKGMIEIYKLPAQMREQAIKAATLVAQTHGGSFSEAAGIAAGHHGDLIGGDSIDQASRIFDRMMYGRRSGSTGHFTQALVNARAHASGASTISTENDLNDKSNDKKAFQDSEYAYTHKAQDAAGRDLDEAQDPATWKHNEQVRLLTEHLNETKKLVSLLDAWTRAQTKMGYGKYATDIRETTAKLDALDTAPLHVPIPDTPSAGR